MLLSRFPYYGHVTQPRGNQSEESWLNMGRSYNGLFQIEDELVQSNINKDYFEQ